jgi:hypothetical protein
MRKVFVTVYNETQAYGGAEEGGWYYKQGEPVEGVYTLCCGIGDGLRDHEDTCPAKAVSELYYGNYVQGHKEEYLRSFTHRPDGVSWLDSDEDAPDEYRGELATSGNYVVTIENFPPEPYPKERLYYS